MTEGYEPTRRLYRSRHGVIFGVCRGLADYSGINVAWVRLAAIIIFFVTGFFPAIAGYVLVAVIMNPEPVRPFTSAEDEEFYGSYTSSRTAALHRLKRTMDRLDSRIRRMENVVTSREYDWERRLNS
jgi:phage shock protein C